MQREKFPHQPSHRKDDAHHAVLREAGRRAERLFREVLGRLYDESALAAARYPEVAAAEVVAVAAGRKPLYHELLSEEAVESIADILRFLVPEEVTVAAQACHLIAYREPDVRAILAADLGNFYPRKATVESVIWWAVKTGQCGELLGYGAQSGRARHGAGLDCRRWNRARGLPRSGAPRTEICGGTGL